MWAISAEGGATRWSRVKERQTDNLTVCNMLCQSPGRLCQFATPALADARASQSMNVKTRASGLFGPLSVMLVLWEGASVAVVRSVYRSVDAVNFAGVASGVSP